MVKRILNLTLIIAFLVSVCLWEHISVTNYFKAIDSAILQIETKVSAGVGVDSNEMLYEVENLEEIWLRKESAFSIVLNHQQVEVIGVEISKMKASVVNNDEVEFNISLSAIHFYITNLSHIFGLSLQNLF